MTRFANQLSELWQIGQEGTWAGAIRYARYKARPPATSRRSAPRRTGVGVAGAGTHVASVLLPCLRAHGAVLRSIGSLSGATATALAHLYDIAVVHPTIKAIVEDDACDALVIATPHHLHPEHILVALASGRYAYCEKPVAIDQAGIDRLLHVGQGQAAASKVMIGFNRRFAPAVERLRQEDWLVHRRAQLELHYRVNFGPRVANAMSDPAVGGGRIHGAACHYVDLISFLAGVDVAEVSARAIHINGRHDDNTFAACMTLADGSVATLAFGSEGSRAYVPKEELVLSCGGHVARIVDFAQLSVDARRHRVRRHRFGSMAAIGAFLRAKKRYEPVPIQLHDGIRATEVTLAIQRSLREHGASVRLPTRGTE